MESERDVERNRIDRALQAVDFGFDLDVLGILMSDSASAEEIESLKFKLNSEIVARLYVVANSVYYGQLRRGVSASFKDVVMALGTYQTMALIIVFGLFSSRKIEGHAVQEMMFAGVVATAIFSRAIAQDMSFSSEAASRAEIIGLLSGLGEFIAMEYSCQSKKDLEEQEERLARCFIDKYQRLIPVRLAEKLGLPEYIQEGLAQAAEKKIYLGATGFCLSSVVLMASAMVREVIVNHGEFKLVLVLPPLSPDSEITLGEKILKSLLAVGLGEQLVIERK